MLDYQLAPPLITVCGAVETGGDEIGGDMVCVESVTLCYTLLTEHGLRESGSNAHTHSGTQQAHRRLLRHAPSAAAVSVTTASVLRLEPSDY